MTGFSDNPFDKLRSRPDAEVWSASGAVQVGMGEAPAGEGPGFVSELFSASAGWASSQQVTQAPPVMTRSEKVDWPIVAELASTATDEIEAEITRWSSTHDGVATLDIRQAIAEPAIASAVATYADRRQIDVGETWPDLVRQRYRKAVWDQLFGMGRLQPLFEIGDAENIIVVGNHEVVVDHNDGSRSTLPPVADSDSELESQIARMARNATPRRAFDADHTDVTIMHEQKFRIHAISSEVSLQPSVVIRQHLLTQISLGDLSQRGMMPVEVARFLDQAVQAGKSIVVAGEQGAGKTTFLRALIHAIPMRERFATLETDQELFAHLMPGRQDTLVLFARDGNGEVDPATGTQHGAIEIAQLIPPSLRQALTRVIVGEVRGNEASAMFQAMQSGTGTMSSIHSPRASEVPSRLAQMISMGPVYDLDQAMLQIGHSIDYIVFVRKRDLPDGSRLRFVEQIRSVSPGDSTTPSLGEVYTADAWTGQPLTPLMPGSAADELSHFARDLDYCEAHS